VSVAVEYVVARVCGHHTRLESVPPAAGVA
jgi:hypothetical protein